ncbi:MAG: HPr family phosphocarrier protein [Eubacteriales bacterium]|nr:HPr family phosphocarrier protein [Eubacteriales bacterium]
MVSRAYIIKNKAGLHLKPAARLCTEAIKYQSTIKLSFGNTTTNAKSVLNVLSACVKCNDEIILSCDGEDENEAIESIGKLIEEGLGE